MIPSAFGRYPEGSGTLHIPLIRYSLLLVGSQKFILLDLRICERYYALGKTDSGRRLFLVNTFRNNLVRVISAWDMKKNEKREYERLQGEQP